MTGPNDSALSPQYSRLWGRADLGVAHPPLPGPLEDSAVAGKVHTIILQVRLGSSDGVPITNLLGLLWQEGKQLPQNSREGSTHTVLARHETGSPYFAL